MNYTNNHNLPTAVFEALTNDSYDPGESDFSCTTLLKSPRMVWLEKRHADELVEDAMGRLWSVLGTAVHNIFEEHVEDDAVAEIRMYLEVLGKKIGGQLDHYKRAVISDYKCTSVWTWIYGSRISEWTEQQNIYAEIYRENGFDVKKLQIIAVFRDWKETDFLKNPSQYPPQPIMIINLDVWGKGKARPFIEQRTQLMLDAEHLADEDLPLCSEQEMWAMPTKYAVMKNALVRASRVLLTQEEAEEYIVNAKAKDKQASTYRVEVRQGKRNRCERYCSAAPFCSQHKQFLADNKGEV